MLFSYLSNTYDLHAHGHINSLLQACLCQHSTPLFALLLSPWKMIEMIVRSHFVNGRVLH